MSLQSLLFTLLSLITLILNVPSAALPDSTSGQWLPIKNVHDPLIVDLAKFAVSTYDQKHMADLTYGKVVKGEYRIGDGTDYNMYIWATSATNSSAGSGVYESFIYDNPVLHYRYLFSFAKTS